MMNIRNPQLNGERITLTSIKEVNKKEAIALFTNSEIKETYMLPSFKDEEEKETFFYRIKAVSENLDRFVYGIYLKETMIGFLNEVSKEDKTIEVGYFIHPTYWNKGYASEALKLAIRELFRIGYEHVKAAHFVGNNASARVMMKAGMHITNEEEVIEYLARKHRCIYYQIDKE